MMKGYISIRQLHNKQNGLKNTFETHEYTD